MLYFNKDDLARLKKLNEPKLYVLNRELLDLSSEVKRIILADEGVVLNLVLLAETAAKEVAERNSWEPISCDGIYSIYGITYDTPRYRDWLKANHDTVWPPDFLQEFSFWTQLQELKKQAGT